MKLTCADPTCERAPMRERDSQRWCMWHPDQTAPDIDLISGKLRGPDGKPKKEPSPSEILRPSDELTVVRRPTYRAPGRVTIGPAPADGICTDPACDRPYRHRGVHATAKTEEQAPTDGLCPVEHCDRPWRHRGVHRKPQTTAPAQPRRTWSNTSKSSAPSGRQPNPVDATDAIRRYQDGEGLHALAADLHIGANTLRQLLRDHDIRIRSRGEVITPRDSHARPLDIDRCLELYAAGHTSTQIARELQVKTTRVQNALRAAGALRPPGGRPPGAGAVNSVRLKLGPDTSAAVRRRAAHLGVPIGHYLRDLVLADLTTAGVQLEQAS